MKVKEEEKFFLRDDVANMILNDSKYKDYLSSILASILHIDKKYIFENLEYAGTRLHQNVDQKHSVADTIVELPENFINIEINYNDFKESKYKNNFYVYYLVIRQTQPNESYTMSKNVIQINLNNYDYFKKNDFVYHSKMIEEKYGMVRDEMIQIIDINLDFLFTLGYNDIKKLKEKDLAWLLYIFVCKDEKLREKIYENDKMMKRVGEKLKEMTGKYDDKLFYNPEEFRNKAIYHEGFDEGKLEGIEEGIKNEKEEIVKLMIHKYPIEDIIEITHLTKEEIESLQKEINSTK